MIKLSKSPHQSFYKYNALSNPRQSCNCSWCSICAKKCPFTIKKMNDSVSKELGLEEWYLGHQPKGIILSDIELQKPQRNVTF